MLKMFNMVGYEIKSKMYHFSLLNLYLFYSIFDLSFVINKKSITTLKKNSCRQIGRRPQKLARTSARSLVQTQVKVSSLTI